MNGEVRPESALRAPAPGLPTLNQCTISSSFSLRQCSLVFNGISSKILLNIPISVGLFNFGNVYLV